MTATTTGVSELIERLRGPVFGTQTALDAAAAIETWKTRAERLADMHRDMCVVAGEAVARAETAEAALEAALSTAPSGDGVPEAATALVNFAWSAVVTDCTESAEYLNELVDNLRSALETTSAGDGVPGMVLDGAIADIEAERRRQIEAEGWTPEHDDQHDGGEIAAAAVCYAFTAVRSPHEIQNRVWPWSSECWKPTDRRRNLVKAGALIVAEIERLDRRTALSQRGTE